MEEAHLITSLLLLLVFSRLFGRLARSMGYLDIIGEIIAGLLLGPALFGFLHPTEQLAGIVELGVFLLMFAAGLEMDLQEVFRALKKRALICAACAFLIPLGIGVGLGKAFSLSFLESVVIGLVIAITALPVTVRFLVNTKLTEKPVGVTVMGTAILIDVAALLFLGILFDDGFKEAEALSMIKTVGITSLKMILFFIVIMGINRFLRYEINQIERVANFIKQLQSRFGEEFIFGFAIFSVLVIASGTEILGFHFIIGAFFGGMLIDKDIFGQDTYQSLNRILGAITNGFFAPIFFAYIGLQFSREAFDEIFLLLGIVAVGYIGKVLAAYLGGRLSGFNHADSKRMGLILNSRGVLDIVVADLALEKGYISHTTFSVLVLLGIIAVILNPILYKKLVGNSDESEGAKESQTPGSPSPKPAP